MNEDRARERRIVDWTLETMRSALLEQLAEHQPDETVLACGHLIDAITAWSEAYGMVHGAHTGSDPVIKYCVAPQDVEVWALYPSAAKGGVKLSLLPGLSKIDSAVRNGVADLFSEPNLEVAGTKMDVALASLAERSRWTEVFLALTRAAEFARARAT